MGGEEVNMRIYFLSIEEYMWKRCGKVEGWVVGVVCVDDEGVCEGSGGKVGREEGFVVDVGGFFVVGGGYDGLCGRRREGIVVLEGVMCVRRWLDVNWVGVGWIWSWCKCYFVSEVFLWWCFLWVIVCDV